MAKLDDNFPVQRIIFFWIVIDFIPMIHLFDRLKCIEYW